MVNLPIIVYSIPNCPYCKTLKDNLTERGIEFTDVDVSLDENDAKFDEIMKVSGTDSVPTVTVGKNLLAPDVNFSSIDQATELIEYILENEDE